MSKPCSECKRLRQELTHLVKAVDAHLTGMDNLFKDKQDADRGRKIALCLNVLTKMYERALNFGLGRDKPFPADPVNNGKLEGN